MNNFPATNTVHWPTGPVHACADHTSKLRGLAVFFGMHVTVTEAPDGAQCANCENEHRLAQPRKEQGQAAMRARGWPEDAPHENGEYENRCCQCGEFFIGHKRRVVCKICATRETQPDLRSQNAALAAAKPVALPEFDTDSEFDVTRVPEFRPSTDGYYTVSGRKEPVLFKDGVEVSQPGQGEPE